MSKILKIFVIVLLVILLILPFQINSTKAAPLQVVTSTDLINLINGWRTANGYSALEVDPILMTTAYDTAVYMAVNGMRSHIGDVSGRIAAYGYGGGATVFATENFAIGPWTIDQIAVGWSDEAHMFPATNPSYVHIGAGVYEYGDRVWYIVHAAYTSGTFQYTPNPTQLLTTSTPPTSQLIIPVKTVTPDENGAVIHEVLSGQALWSIAIAYDTKIDELVRLNNLNPADPTLYVGQKLLIFEANRTPEPTVITPTIDPSQITPTSSPTIRPTRTNTVTPSPTDLPINATPTITPDDPENQGAFFGNLFQNKVIGVVLVSLLALGILMIVSGSFGKKPEPNDVQKEEDE